MLAEEYQYKEHGQRIRGYSRYDGKSEDFAYNSKGQLASSGDVKFTYSPAGTLKTRQAGEWYTHEGLKTDYRYEGTRLIGVKLPNGNNIRYEYGAKNSPNPEGPCRKYLDGKPAAEFTWLDLTRLGNVRDLEQGLNFRFHYGKRQCPEKLVITPISTQRKAPLQGSEGEASRPLLAPGERLVLTCGCDQVGSLKILTAEDGSIYKQIKFDSFGNVLEETGENIHIPVGFAGGLADRNTNLVRFGFRDYDPQVGRFTCKDPSGDTGGDHDLYDYCVDDPVTGKDSEGLAASFLGKFFVSKMAKKIAGVTIGAPFDTATADAPTLGLEDKINELEEIRQEISQIEAMIEAIENEEGEFDYDESSESAATSAEDASQRLEELRQREEELMQEIEEIKYGAARHR